MIKTKRNSVLLLGRELSRDIALQCMEGRKEMFYLTTHSTHFIYGYMASDIWLRTILIVRKETRCRHIGYSFRLASRVLLYSSVVERPLIKRWVIGSIPRVGPIEPFLVPAWKEMFYLTTHSTNFILRLYGVGRMVKDHSYSERGNPLPPHGLLFPINRKGFFICTISQTG